VPRIEAAPQKSIMNYSYNNNWAELCCFGNPKRIDHTKIDPTYYVYAVLVNPKYVDSLPGNINKCPWVIADGENSFIDKIKSVKGVYAISKGCAINRTDATCPDLSFKSPTFNEHMRKPVKPQWEPDGKMFVELYNSGCLIFSDYLKNGSDLPINTSSLGSQKSSYFQIVITEKKGNECSATTWFKLIE
jgi:hypothetical protein